MTTAELRGSWAAPTAAGAVHASVSVPGSKSMTNRALVLAALADGPSLLHGALASRDTSLMTAALRAMGVELADEPAGLLVTPAPLRGPASVDVGLAGTVMRFLPAVATVAEGAVAFDGDPRARERPVGELLDALRRLGGTVDDDGRGALPFTVVGTGGIPGGHVDIDASASSQLVSALLLTAARWDRGVEVRHVGAAPVPNAPHVAMTVAMLRDRGVEVDHDADRWRVAPGRVAARDEAVEPDLSSAAPFLAAAVVTGGEVRVERWPARSTQPGALLPELLGEFGATSSVVDGALVLRGPQRVRGTRLDLRDAGELTPVLAAVAAVAADPSSFTGIGYLRGHETDRLAALARELQRLGGDVDEDGDGLTIRPRPLHAETFRTYADHRLAMAGAVIGLVTPGVVLDDVGTTAKTFPGFADAWLAMLSGGAR